MNHDYQDMLADFQRRMREAMREAANKINAQNQRKAQKRNQTRLLGVSWHKGRSMWQAGIRYQGKFKYLGLFTTPEEAHQAYIEAKRKLHEGCTI